MPTFETSTSYPSTFTNSVVINVPSGVAAGDGVVVCIVALNTLTITCNSPPTGFSALTPATFDSASAGNDLTLMVCEKRATGSDTGTYTFGLSASATVGAVALRYSGCNAAGSLFDTDTDSAGNDDNDTTAAVTIDTTANNCELIWVNVSPAGYQIATPATGFSPMDFNGVNDDSDFGWGIGSKTLAAAGSSGSVSGTWNASHAYSALAWLKALLPAGPGPPVSLKATGAWAETTTDPTAATLVGTPAAGDRYFLFVAWKAYGTTCEITSPQAWTEVTEYADGAVAAGSNVGSVKVACYYRDWVSGDGNPSIDWSTGPAPAVYVMQLWQKDPDYDWGTPLYATAAHASSAGPVTREAGSGTTAVPDDSVVFALWGIRDDSATFTRGASDIDVASGITWNGNYVESPATHISTTTSNDISADLGHRFVTTGGTVTLRSSVQALSNAETGAILWVVQGVTAAGPVEWFGDITKAITATVIPGIGKGTNIAVTRTATATVTPGAGKGTNIGVTRSVTATIAPVLTLGHTQTANVTRTATAAISPAAKTNQNAGMASAVTATITSALRLGHAAGLSETVAAVVISAAVRGQSAGITEATNAAITPGAGKGTNIGVTEAITATISPTASVKTNWTAGVTEAVTATVTPAAAIDQDITIAETVTATVTAAAIRGWIADTTAVVLASITPTGTIGHALTGVLTSSIIATISPAAKSDQNIATNVAATATIDITAQVSQVGETAIDLPVTATISPAARTDLNAGLAIAGNHNIDMVMLLGLKMQISAATTATITSTALIGHPHVADIIESVTATIESSMRADLLAALTHASSAVITTDARTDQRIATTVTAAATIDTAALVSTPGTAGITIDSVADIDATARVASETGTAAVVVATIGVSATVNKSAGIQSPIAAVMSVGAIVDAHAGTTLPLTAAITVNATKHADLGATVIATAAITADAVVTALGQLLDVADRYTIIVPVTPEVTIVADIITIPIHTETTATISVRIADTGIPEIPVTV